MSPYHLPLPIGERGRVRGRVTKGLGMLENFSKTKVESRRVVMG